MESLIMVGHKDCAIYDPPKPFAWSYLDTICI